MVLEFGILDVDTRFINKIFFGKKKRKNENSIK